MGKNKSTKKIIDEIATGLDTMQVFQQARCTSRVKCDRPAVILTALFIDWADSIAIGLLCIEHAEANFEQFLKLGEREQTDGDVQ